MAGTVSGRVVPGWLKLAVVLCAAEFVVGCSSGISPGSGSQPPQSVIVSGPAATRLGATAQFTAAVTGGSSTAVNWQVNGIVGGNANTGTISSTGLYTAPAALPTPDAVTVSATSTSDQTASGSLSETIWNPVPQLGTVTATLNSATKTVAIDALGANFVAGAQVQVGGASVATTVVSSTELQANVPVVAGTTSLVVNALNPNPGAVASASVTVTIQGSVITVVVTGPADTRLGGTSQFAAAVSGSGNSAVTWQVNGVAGGSAASGMISASGVYTAPMALPTPDTVTISAISQADATAAGSLSEAVWNPLPVLTSLTATQSGSATSFALDALGSNFVAGAKLQVGGASVTTTVVSATELQATITVAAGTASVVVNAVNPDPGSAASASQTVQLPAINVTVAAASRLLDQSSFGTTTAGIQHVQSVGLDGYLTEQFGMTPSPFADIPSPEPATCPFVPQNCAQSEWWQDALTGQDQLRQRVAFALSEIFVISTGMDTGDEVPPYQRMLLKDAFGNFSTLMKDVTLSAGMGDYLNTNGSLKPGNGQIAIENYARELMQLFTIGLYGLNQDGTQMLDATGNPIPTYTQAQVQAFARVFTGWTYANASGGSPTIFPNTMPNYDSPMAPVESAHDVAAKTLLNGTVLPANQTAEQDMDGALANIFAQPNVGPFVCKQLIQHLVSSNPSPAYVGRIAAVFADDGTGVRGNLQAVVRAILMDPEARAGDTDPTVEGGHLREGLLYLVEVMRALGYVNDDPNNYYYQLWPYGALLDEQPYAAASVFNFFPPSYVIPGTTTHAPEFAIENTATATQRESLANTLVFNDLPGFQSDFATTGELGQLAGDPDTLVDALSTLFMHGQMPAGMHTAIVNQISPLSDYSQRTRVATYLTITSSLYKIEH